MIVRNGLMVLPDRILAGHRLLVREGRIAAILPEDAAELQEEAAVDARGGYILPGMIDLHLHGGMGSDFTDATHEAFETIASFHASHGVTAILAGILSVSKEEICATLDQVREYRRARGAQILGAYMEGPYLSQENKGSHPSECLLVPQRDPYDWLERYADTIRIMTVAPELPGAKEMIAAFTKAGVIVSGGHDKAREPEVREAIAAGMRHTTHMYCVMSEYTRINGVKCPGLTEIALSDDRLTVELIADGLHVPAPMMKIMLRCKGEEGICLVSDCLRPAGMPMDGRLYYMGSASHPRGEAMLVGERAAMMGDHSKLAGSLTTLDQAVACLVRETGIALEKAVRMASLTPAEVLGVEQQMGSLEVGKQADICLMDRELKVQNVWIKGEML